MLISNSRAMSFSISQRISKYLTKYLSSRFVFIMDLFLSVLASWVVLLTLNFTAESKIYASSYTTIWLVASLIASVCVLLLFRCYTIIIRHSTLKDYFRYFLTAFTKASLLLLTIIVFGMYTPATILVAVFDFLLTFFFLVGIRLCMMVVYDIYRNRVKERTEQKRVLVYGTTDKAVAVVTRFANSTKYNIIGFLSNDKHAKGNMLVDKKIFFYENDDDLYAYCDRMLVDCILFPLESDAQNERNGMVQFCINNNIKPLVAPSIDEVVGGRLVKSHIREVKIEDLLGRPEISISMDEIVANFKDKVVLVTGAAGSIGSELCRQLASFGIKQLLLFDNAETPMHNLRLEMEGRYPNLDFIPIIGDVRHPARLDFAFRKWHPQVVFHAAAYKHVPLMEENPCEAVLVNVNGTKNVADKCIEYNVEKMVMISTDKAVNPTNIMGCSKRLAEIYVQSLGVALQQGAMKGNTQFVTTRFGNVLGSNGSVIPRFREQIEKGGPVTVTHPDITRFFMTIPEACRLVMEAATMGVGNQIYVFDMGKSVKIDTLARNMIHLAGLKDGEDIEIVYTGLRPGEKLYEEVLASEENTLPTPHNRIRIAKVREYEYSEVNETITQLTNLSYSVNIPDMVKLMKKIVPEFKSQNSQFEIFDK